MPNDETPPGASRLVEPSEGAFAITVLDGWRVRAGIARQGAEPRLWYLVQRPGGGAELRAVAPWTLLPGMVPRPAAPAGEPR